MGPQSGRGPPSRTHSPASGAAGVVGWPRPASLPSRTANAVAGNRRSHRPSSIGSTSGPPGPRPTGHRAARSRGSTVPVCTSGPNPTRSTGSRTDCALRSPAARQRSSGAARTASRRWRAATSTLRKPPRHPFDRGRTPTAQSTRRTGRCPAAPTTRPLVRAVAPARSVRARLQHRRPVRSAGDVAVNWAWRRNELSRCLAVTRRST